MFKVYLIPIYFMLAAATLAILLTGLFILTIFLLTNREDPFKDAGDQVALLIKKAWAIK